MKKLAYRNDDQLHNDAVKMLLERHLFKREVDPNDFGF